MKSKETPFTVTFTMGSPIVLSKFGLPRLESLLRHRQVVTGGDFNDVLPIASHHCGISAAGGLFSLSKANPYTVESVIVGDAIFRSLVNVGFPAKEADHMVSHGHLQMKSNLKVVSTLQKWTILPSGTLMARGVGDPKSVLEILERDPFIGVGTNLGYGEVLRFDVEEADWETAENPLMSPWVFWDHKQRLTTPIPDTQDCTKIVEASKGMITRGSASFGYPFRIGASQSAFLPVNA